MQVIRICVLNHHQVSLEAGKLSMTIVVVERELVRNVLVALKTLLLSDRALCC